MASENQLLPNIERSFILQALREGQRSDGRFLLEQRKIRFEFLRFGSKAVVTALLGSTRVSAAATASITTPFSERPTEGLLLLNVDISAAAGRWHEGGRPGAEAVELARMLERQIRDARAVDTEALCVIPGVAVWALRVDVTVMNDDGNLVDACGLAAMAALLHFRRPDVTVGEGGAVIVHPLSSHAPSPLGIHHVPVPVTFGLFEEEGTPGSGSSSDSNADGHGTVVVALDPTGREALVSPSRVTLVMNAHGELCGVHKLGGVAVPSAALVACVKVAAEKAAAAVSMMRAAAGAADAVALAAVAQQYAPPQSQQQQQQEPVDESPEIPRSESPTADAAAAAPVHVDDGDAMDADEEPDTARDRAKKARRMESLSAAADASITALTAAAAAAY